MASRDLTSTYFDRRAVALKRRSGGGPLETPSKNRLTAGGSEDGHSLMLMEVRARGTIENVASVSPLIMPRSCDFI
jgi:hypothetical protein